MDAKGLIVAMLYPDPTIRISVQDAQKHPWCYDMHAVPREGVGASALQDDTVDMDIHVDSEVVRTNSDVQMSDWEADASYAQDDEIFSMEEDDSRRAIATTSPCSSAQREVQPPQLPEPFPVQSEASGTWNAPSPASMHFVGRSNTNMFSLYVTYGKFSLVQEHLRHTAPEVYTLPMPHRRQ